MQRRIARFTTVIALGCLCLAGVSDGVEPSDAKQVEMMIGYIEYLEDNPTGTYSATRRETVVKWLTKEKRVAVAVYMEPLNYDSESKKLDYWDRDSLIWQLYMSTAKYHLQNPGCDPNDLDAITAGVEGVLSAYEQFRQNKKRRRPTKLEAYRSAMLTDELRERLEAEILGREYDVLTLFDPASPELRRLLTDRM